MMKNLLKFPKFAQLTGTRGLALMAMAAILLVCGSQPAAAQTRYLTPGGAGSGNGIDWGNAYPSVESALSLMPPGTTLLIKEGTYYPKVTSPLGFPITYPVKFYGGCAGTETSPIGRSGGPTIFDGAASWGTAKHVVNISGVTGTPGVLLDSIEIRGGDANTALQNMGGGVFSVGSDLDMTDCLVYNNHAQQDGGGLYFDGGNEDAKTLNLKRCEFTGNLAGDGSDTGSVGRGGGMFVTWGKGYTVACTFSKNKANLSGGAAYLEHFQPVYKYEFHDSVFWANAATVLQGSKGGAIMLAYNATAGEVQVNACSFAGNYAGACVDGQAIYTDGNIVFRFFNSIAWFNYQAGCGAKPIQNASPANALVQYSDVEGVLGGTGNIQADPMFTNVATGRLRLKKPTSGSPGSPCIDIGSYSLLPTDVLDLDDNGTTAGKLPQDVQGVRRVSPLGGTALDMGAYEDQ